MLLFIDESGHDHVATPYEVLAGVAVAEADLWNLVEAIRSEEMRIFGINLRAAGAEIKGVKSLKKKTFRLASEGEVVPEAERRDLVRTLLLEGVAANAENRPAEVTSRQLVAYGQARLDFIRSLFALIGQIPRPGFRRPGGKQGSPSRRQVLPSQGLFLPSLAFLLLSGRPQPYGNGVGCI